MDLGKIFSDLHIYHNMYTQTQTHMHWHMHSTHSHTRTDTHIHMHTSIQRPTIQKCIHTYREICTHTHTQNILKERNPGLYDDHKRNTWTSINQVRRFLLLPFLEQKNIETRKPLKADNLIMDRSDESPSPAIEDPKSSPQSQLRYSWVRHWTQTGWLEQRKKAYFTSRIRGTTGEQQRLGATWKDNFKAWLCCPSDGITDATWFLSLFFLLYSIVI